MPKTLTIFNAIFLVALLFNLSFAFFIQNNAVPQNTVSWFDLVKCPQGWTKFSSMDGRYIVSIGTGSTNISVGNSFTTDGEEREVGKHTHSITETEHAHIVESSDFKETDGVLFDKTNSTPFTNRQTESSIVGMSVSQEGSTEGTNAPYINLLACQYQ